MHRLASVHLHSFSHYWSRLSVTIATATEQRASFWRLSDSGEKAETTAQTSPIAFSEDEVRGQNFAPEQRILLLRIPARERVSYHRQRRPRIRRIRALC
jgi:hypothetical protein